MAGISKEHETVVRSAIKKQGDPLTKPGIIGAFCRTYIFRGISEYLDEIYGPVILLTGILKFLVAL